MCLCGCCECCFSIVKSLFCGEQTICCMKFPLSVYARLANFLAMVANIIPFLVYLFVKSVFSNIPLVDNDIEKVLYLLNCYMITCTFLYGFLSLVMIKLKKPDDKRIFIEVKMIGFKFIIVQIIALSVFFSKDTMEDFEKAIKIIDFFTYVSIILLCALIVYATINISIRYHLYLADRLSESNVWGYAHFGITAVGFAIGFAFLIAGSVVYNNNANPSNNTQMKRANEIKTAKTQLICFGLFIFLPSAAMVALSFSKKATETRETSVCAAAYIFCFAMMLFAFSCFFLASHVDRSLGKVLASLVLLMICGIGFMIIFFSSEPLDDDLDANQAETAGYYELANDFEEKDKVPYNVSLFNLLLAIFPIFIVITTNLLTNLNVNKDSQTLPVLKRISIVYGVSSLIVPSLYTIYLALPVVCKNRDFS